MKKRLRILYVVLSLLATCMSLQAADKTGEPRATTALTGSSLERENSLQLTKPRIPTIPTAPSSLTREETRSKSGTNLFVQQNTNTQNREQYRRVEQTNEHTLNPNRPISPEKLSQARGSLLSGSFKPPLISSLKEVPSLDEVVVLADTLTQAEAQRKHLSKHGIGIISRVPLTHLGIVQSTFSYRSPETTDSVLKLLRELDPEVKAEANKRFRLQSNPPHNISPKKALGHILSDVPLPTQCRSKNAIAMLDSAVNTKVIDHPPELLTTYQVVKTDQAPDRHGTSVASLLISNSDSFPGLLKDTHLHAISIFMLDANAEPETRTDWILSGLNELAGIQPLPRVVNLSFGGPYSELLEGIYQRLSRQMIFVAAAGNSGSNDMLYPAGYASVIAVGAFNSKKGHYSLSNTGEHIRILGPGEDIWTRNETGKGYYAFGTSFAAPFVSAALLLNDEREKSPNDYFNSLNEKKYVNFSSLCDNKE